MNLFEGAMRVATGTRFAIGASRWNPRIVDALIDGARRTLLANGVPADAVDLVRVPGAWEIPLAADRLAGGGAHLAVIALACVVRGDTRHYEHVADNCAQALMRISLDRGVP